MARLGCKHIDLVIMDSRGTGVEGIIRNIGALNEHFEFKVCKGATLAELVDATETHLNNGPFDVLI